MTDEQALTIPKHVGYIVDGNRRWAKSHGLPPYEGHLAGYNCLKDVLIETVQQGVPYVSAYVFSTENWKRSADEVKRLMALILRILTSDVPIFNEYNVRLKVIGTREGLSAKVLKAIDSAEAATAQNDGGELALCFNYGGQLEIADAVKKIIAAGTKAEDVTEELIAQNLYAPEVPPIDLIVRTSGEQRISNFMLWRAAYSELMFIDKNWPDMTKDDVTFIMNEYTNRQRRFGS
ncbi:di-trans,poly-cis-decaprenylcistransferase [Candidatus Saccharibacteria bacterium 49-20]|nr:MAG: di-trans,poly-cis-decaprenylcistransferase [Candidatus Saccharibacteria bacterium 49-20]